MKGLLIVLCSLVSTVALLAGGCAFLVTGVAALASRAGVDGAEPNRMLAVTVPVLVAAAAVMAINAALIAAVSRGRAPHRSVWFVLLAVVDLVAAGCLVAAWLSQRVQTHQALLLPAALAVKGVLTLWLPAEPRPSSRLPPLPPSRNQEER